MSRRVPVTASTKAALTVMPQASATSPYVSASACEDDERDHRADAEAERGGAVAPARGESAREQGAEQLPERRRR